ncbi:MAG TPA: right-handed parallel beta-helix repeat-containing protein [Terriglobia bacterium]|nr:right-handed parallel beta-helix repeat-containing protein [Terriglobia bacterium]
MKKLLVAILLLPAALAFAQAQTGTGTYDIRGFNAKGDGMHNDGPSFSAAVQAANRAGGTVILPPGVYRFDSRIVLSNIKNVAIEGRDGAVILRDGGAFVCRRCSNVTIKNIGIQNRTVPKVVTVAELPTANPRQIIILDRHSTGFGYIPEPSDDGDAWARMSPAQKAEAASATTFASHIVFINSDHITVSGLHSVKKGFFGIYFDRCHDSEAINNTVIGGFPEAVPGAIAFVDATNDHGALSYNNVADSNNVSYAVHSGILIYGGHHIRITGNVVHDSSETGIKIGQEDSRGSNFETYLTISGNTSYRNHQEGFDLMEYYPPRGSDPAYSTATDNVSHDNDSQGIQVDGKYWTVTGNTIYSNQHSGLMLDGENNVISNNVIYHNGLRAGNSNEVCYGCTSRSQTGNDVITGNKIRSDHGNNYGIYIAHGNASSTFSNNEVTGTTHQKEIWDVSSQRNVFKRNTGAIGGTAPAGRP